MKKSLLVVLLLAACGGGGNSGQSPQVASPPAGPSPADLLADQLAGLTLEEFYVESYGALFTRSPESIVWQALDEVFPVNSADLDDVSDAYVADTFAMYQVALDALRAYDRAALNSSDRVSYDFYEWYLENNVSRQPFEFHDFPATYSLWGTQQATERFFTDIHPLETVSDAEDYIARLLQVERKFGQLVEHLEQQRRNGIVEPALTMQIAIAQVTPLAEGPSQSNPYFTSFATQLARIDGLATTIRLELESRALDAVARSVIPAYIELLSKLRDLRNNAPPGIGVGQFPRGSNYYAYQLRHHTTTSMTASDIHQLGLTELIRIHAEMRSVFDDLGYPQNESLQELFARVASDGGIVPSADVQATYESIIAIADQRLTAAFDVFPSADVIVAPDEFGGFYIGPSFDGSRPGVFYAGNSVDQPWFPMPSLAYHEAVPGHHTQIAIAMEQDVPAFRKIARVTAFVEGWALYAERLAFELGWYDQDPYGNLGRLQYEALRAARLVIDTGIHDLGWTFDEAVRFNEDQVGWSTSASRAAVARYSVAPGQATAYMIGMLRILSERQRAMDELGDQFDLTEFHRALLATGAVPLDLLESVVDAYIDDVRASP